MYTYTLDFASLALQPETVLHEMGYGEVEPEENIKNLVDELFAEVAAITIPQCSFDLFKGCLSESSVLLEMGDALPVGAVLTTILKNATRFALFAATAGSAFQAYQNKLKEEGDILNCFVTDVIGTCIAEATGDYMERMLEKVLDGERHTNRLSPGYCGWHLSGQKQLFRLMGENPCDISLSEVCLMTPVKSISGIIGIGENVDEKKYGCQFCELETCYKRKKKKK